MKRLDCFIFLWRKGAVHHMKWNTFPSLLTKEKLHFPLINSIFACLLRKIHTEKKIWIAYYSFIVCIWKYEGYLESNACYFTMLSHDIRGRCWYYGSRGWTFLTILHYILLLSDQWQQGNILTQRNLTWKCGVSFNFFVRKKWQPLTFTDTC